MKLIFWLFLILIAYVFLGYPFLLMLISKFKRTKRVQKREVYPKISLIIPAYNEEKAIRERIENILSLEYPKDKLEIIIASDASTDKTDEIILQYGNSGIILNRQPQRRGKTAVLNDSVHKSSGEILVFSDADILFKEDDIKKLARNFADPAVGCVVGIKKIIADDKAMSNAEGLYWKYELFLKELESETGSVSAGASGCNFAMKKELFVPLEDKTTAEDLALPLICISRGYRVVFEGEAVSYEKLLPDFKNEFIRKIRLVTGGLHAISLVTDKFSEIDRFTLFKLFSHKILRWCVPFLLAGVFTANFFIKENIYYLFLLAQTIFYSFAFIGFLLNRSKIEIKGLLSKFFDIPLYFTSMNMAALIGVLRYALKMHKGWVSYEKGSRKGL